MAEDTQKVSVMTRKASHWRRWGAAIGLASIGILAHAGVDTQSYSAYAAYKSGDYAKAERLWRDAAERGSTDAMINIANLYVQGQGVDRDLGRAADWYRQAAEAGDPVAQVHLGEAYESGAGLARDNRAAARWFRRAAEQGDAHGAFNLGVMLATDYGNGLEASDDDQRAMARHWLRAAADNGHREAARMLQVLEQALEGDGS